MNALSNPKVAGIIWLVVRVWLGFQWFIHGIEKVFGAGSEVWVGSKAGVAVTGFLNGAIAKSPLAEGFDPIKTPHPSVQEWYATLVRDIFIPNAQIFSYLVAWGELLVGLALILGVLTRFSAVMGVLMNLAFLYAGTSSDNPTMLVIGLAVVMMVGVAVGYYGLDYFLRPIEKNIVSRVRERFVPAPQVS